MIKAVSACMAAVFVRAVGFDGDGRALCGGEHHQSHDAFAVDAVAVARYPDVALEGGGRLNEFARRAGVQAEFVDDFDFLFEHECPLNVMFVK